MDRDSETDSPELRLESMAHRYRDYTSSAPIRDLEADELLSFLNHSKSTMEFWNEGHQCGPAAYIKTRHAYRKPTTRRVAGVLKGVEKRGRLQRLQTIVDGVAESHDVTTTHAVIAITADSWEAAGATEIEAARIEDILATLHCRWTGQVDISMDIRAIQKQVDTEEGAEVTLLPSCKDLMRTVKRKHDEGGVRHHGLDAERRKLRTALETGQAPPPAKIPFVLPR